MHHAESHAACLQMSDMAYPSLSTGTSPAKHLALNHETQSEPRAAGVHLLALTSAEMLSTMWHATGKAPTLRLPANFTQYICTNV